MYNFTRKERLAIAKMSFTKEEFLKLCLYESGTLLKKYINPILYTTVTSIWAMVFILCFELFRKASLSEQIILTQNNSSTTNIVEKTYQTQQIENVSVKNDRNKLFNGIIEAIDAGKSEKATYSSSYIYFKVMSYSTKFNINFSYLLALIETESNFVEDIKAKDYSTTGSVGWSQATNRTWETFRNQYVMSPNGLGLSKEKADLEWSHNKETLSNIDKSLTFICWYLNWLTNNYPEKTNTPYKLYCAYNAGPRYKDSNKHMILNANRFMGIYDKYYVAYSMQN